MSVLRNCTCGGHRRRKFLRSAGMTHSTRSRHISQIRKFYREAHTITQQHGRIWYAEEHGYAARLAKRADRPVRVIWCVSRRSQPALPMPASRLGEEWAN